MKDIARKIYAKLRAFQEVAALLVFYFGWGFNPLMPDLVVSYSTEPYFLPLLESGTQAGQMTNRLPDVELYTITLENKGSGQIDSIEVVIRGVRAVWQKSARASFKRFDSLGAATTNSLEDDGALVFAKIDPIPPGQNITIQFVAQTYKLLFGERIEIVSNARATRVYRLASVAGLFSFLDQHSDFLLGLLIVGAIVMGLRRSVRGASQ